MNRQRMSGQVMGMALIVVLLLGCGAPEATPVSEAPALPEATSTPQPPAPTATPLPATDAPTPAPTDVPPSPTTEPPALPPESPAPTVKPPTPTTEPPADTPVPATEAPPAEFTISTTAFEPDGEIPQRYSCLGSNVSPALAWAGVPAGAQSLLLLVYDLDAGFKMGASAPVGFAHWMVFNIPPGSSGYAEDMPAGESLADGALQGSNDFAQFESAGATFPGGAPVKLVGYDGPCPPARHRYRFALYALDTVLGLPAGATMSQILEAMEGHVLVEAAVVGAFAPGQ